MQSPLERTGTWDRPPLHNASQLKASTQPIGSLTRVAGQSGSSLDRTLTWDRAPLLSAPTALGQRTATWDRPAAQAVPVSWGQPQPQLLRTLTKEGISTQGDITSFARTVTVLDRVREASNKFMAPLQRPSTYPAATQTQKAPPVGVVPPTTLTKTAWQPLSTKQPSRALNMRQIPEDQVASAKAASGPFQQQQLVRARSPLARANTVSLGSATVAARDKTVDLPAPATASAPGEASQLQRPKLLRAHTVGLGQPGAPAIGARPLPDGRQQSFWSCLSRTETTGSTSPSEEVLYRGTTLASPQATGLASPSGTLVSAQSTEFSSPRLLRKAPTVDLGLVRTQSSRAASVAAAKRSEASKPPTAHEADERGASVPPPPAKVDASSSFQFSASAAAFVPSAPATQVQLEAEVSVAPQPDAPSERKQKMGKQLLALALGGDVQRQLRIIVAGLMGSGKSTLCRMLADLLGGTWVNQDEFAHKGKAAKRAFLAAIAEGAADKKVPVLLVDKINTMRQHRREILEAMESGVAGDILLIQLRHPSDKPDRFDQAIKLCLSRINGRGEGHRTLKPSDPKLDIGKILRQTVSGVEPMGEDELRRFAASYTVDMTLSPPEMVQKILTDLDEADFLWRFPVEQLLQEQRIKQAFQFTKDAEANLAGGASAPAEAQPAKGKGGGRGRGGGGRGNNGNSKSPDSRSQGKGQPKKPPPLWMYTLEFDAVTIEAIRGLWQSSHGGRAPQLTPQKEFHVTLLYMGGGSDAEIASRHPSLPSPEEVKRLREDLANLEGQELEVQIKEVVWDDRLSAAAVTLPRGGLCANVNPHITIALAPGVKPVKSNELLARRAANDNIRTGLGNWLDELGMQQYKAQVLEWCLSMGAASTDEIAENATDLAASVENTDTAQRERVQAIFSSAAPGELQIATPAEPLRLCGKVVAKLRGQ